MFRIAAFTIVVAGLALSSPAFAQSYSDPKALLEALYAGYMPPNEFPPDTAPFQSARLNGLFDKDEQEANGDIGRVDFNPYVNGQDYQITDVVVAEPYLVGGKAVVKVTFQNMGAPLELGYLLVDEDGWKIDDVWYAGDDFSYDLLDMLQAPMP